MKNAEKFNVKIKITKKPISHEKNEPTKQS